MSVQLSTLSLATVLTGSVGTIDLSSLNLSAAPVDPIDGPFAHLLCLNDSGVTFVIAPTTQKQKQTVVPANRLTIVEVPPGEASLTWTVLAVYPFIYTPQCFLFYYLPYEPVKIHDLGAVSAGQFGNQIRSVGVPIAVVSRNNIWSPGAVNATITVFTQTGLTLPVGQLISNYCYALQISQYGDTTADTLDVGLQVQLLDNTSAVIAGPNTVHRVVLSTAVSTGLIATWNSYPAELQQFSGWPAGAGGPYQIQWILKSLAQTGTPKIVYNILVDSDSKSKATPGTIGMFTPQAGSF